MVWEIIDKVYKLIGEDVPDIEELEKKLDKDTYSIYENKLTCTINQADSDFATGLISKYKPQSVEEMCAFVACIRPSFASLLDNFINRRSYTTGVAELDDILKDSFHYMMYQESIMKYLIWLGIDESESYSILKKISKKKFKEAELVSLKDKLHKGWIEAVGREEGFHETWEVVENGAKYGFNSSHSLAYAYDSLYGAYLKSHYPLEYYSVVLNLYQNDMERTTKLINELKFFGIKLEKAKFRFSKSEYFFNKETKTIYKGIESIKYMNKEAGDFLYTLKDLDLTFVELIEKTSKILDTRKMEILIKLDYFSEFGGSEYLLKIFTLYKKYGKVKQLKKEGLEIPIHIMEECSSKETQKLYKEIDNLKLIKLLSEKITNCDICLKEKIKTELEFSGIFTPIPEMDRNRFIVLEKKNFKHSVLTLINIKYGKRLTFRADKVVVSYLEKYDIIKINNILKKQKNIKVDGVWKKSSTEFNHWINEFEVIE